MIAKVIALGDDRAMALDRLAGALRGFEVAGVTTNVPFLSRLAANSGFGPATSTPGSSRELDALLARGPIPDSVLAATAMHAAGRTRRTRGWSRLGRSVGDADRLAAVGRRGASRAPRSRRRGGGDAGHLPGRQRLPHRSREQLNRREADSP